MKQILLFSILSVTKMKQREVAEDVQRHMVKKWTWNLNLCSVTSKSLNEVLPETASQGIELKQCFNVFSHEERNRPVTWWTWGINSIFLSEKHCLRTTKKNPEPRKNSMIKYSWLTGLLWAYFCLELVIIWNFQ